MYEMNGFKSARRIFYGIENLMISFQVIIKCLSWAKKIYSISSGFWEAWHAFPEKNINKIFFQNFQKKLYSFT